MGYVNNTSEALICGFNIWNSHTLSKHKRRFVRYNEMGGMTSWAHPKLKDAKRWLSIFADNGLQARSVSSDQQKTFC